MPDAFAVTTPTTTVTLDTSRVGQVSFTVSNISGRPLRARLRPLTQDPMKAEWLTVTGAAQRDFALGATEVFVVSVAVPADVPAGTYSFRGDAVGEDQPDEDFAQGPTVALTVPAAPVKPKFPWWIVAVAVAVLIIGGIVFFVIKDSGGSSKPSPSPTSGTVSIPNVVGQGESQAVQQLQALGLVPTVATQESATPIAGCQGNVIATSPAANSTAPVGTTVFVVVTPHTPPAIGCTIILHVSNIPLEPILSLFPRLSASP